MIQKSSIVNIIDKCNIYTGNTFHIYKGFKKRFGYCGDFIKFSIRQTHSSLVEQKGLKSVGILVRTTKFICNKDGTLFFTKQNSLVSLKKRLTPKGKELVGPASRVIKRKKFLLSFVSCF